MKRLLPFVVGLLCSTMLAGPVQMLLLAGRSGVAAAPTITAASVNGSTLTLTFSAAAVRGGSYSNAHLDLDATTTGSNLGLTYVSGDNTTTWTMTVASPIVNGETVDLDFTGTSNSIEATSGGADLAAITSMSVTNATSGGSPAWSESVAIGSTDTSDPVDNTLAVGAPVVAGQSGSCTKLRFALYSWNFSAGCKIALFNSSDVPIATETVTIGSDPGNGNYEITLSTPVSVSNGVTYRVMVESSANSAWSHRYISGQPSGSGQYISVAYASFPQNPSTFSNHTVQWSMGMYIVP